jgi:hypothetical protein
MGKLFIQIACLAVALGCVPVCLSYGRSRSISNAGIPCNEFAGISSQAKIFLFAVAALLATVEFFLYQ